VITEFATGYPGYNSLVPKSAGSVGEVLKENGYNTAWFGKMHNVPDWMSSQAGPFDLWPSGLGFEYFQIPTDLVVDRWASDGESGSHRPFLFRYDIWTMFWG
jgi:arylsulfatase A-like enzyme